jgi:hypothetical protein
MGMPESSSSGLTLFRLVSRSDGKGHWVSWVFFTQPFSGTMCFDVTCDGKWLKALAASNAKAIEEHHR